MHRSVYLPRLGALGLIKERICFGGGGGGGGGRMEVFISPPLEAHLLIKETICSRREGGGDKFLPFRVTAIFQIV